MVGMTPTDLQTLLLSVSRARAEQVGAPVSCSVGARIDSLRPSVADPRRLAGVGCHISGSTCPQNSGIAARPSRSARQLRGDRDTSIRTGSCRRYAVPRSSAINECAGDRGRIPKSAEPIEDVHLAACHRVLRGQRFTEPSAAAHFETARVGFQRARPWRPPHRI